MSLARLSPTHIYMERFRSLRLFVYVWHTTKHNTNNPIQYFRRLRQRPTVTVKRTRTKRKILSLAAFRNHHRVDSLSAAFWLRFNNQNVVNLYRYPFLTVTELYHCWMRSSLCSPVYLGFWLRSLSFFKSWRMRWNERARESVMCFLICTRECLCAWRKVHKKRSQRAIFLIRGQFSCTLRYNQFQINRSFVFDIQDLISSSFFVFLCVCVCGTWMDTAK